ncbi:MAG: 30S ribosomal protein S16 [Planctomycetes bacterium]|nr:30S ribosomal protein S16 [Planctomycetota bacterium]
MSVRIRLSRYGRLHRPYFRIIAIDKRRHREGEANEILGSYDPLLKDKNIQVDMDKVQGWIARGALVSTGLSNLLKFHGYQLPAKPEKKAPAKAPAGKKKAPAGKKGEKQPWIAPSRRALRKHAAKLKGERKVTTETAKAKHAAAKAAKAAAAAPAEGAAPTEPAKT